MERRAASFTEEEELNQRRRLLNQARKGDLKAINKLFELYQVRVYRGDNLKKIGKIPPFPPAGKGRGNVSLGKPQAGIKGKPGTAKLKPTPVSKQSKPSPKAAAEKSAHSASKKIGSPKRFKRK